MPPSESIVAFRRIPASLDRASIESFANLLKKRLRTEFTCLLTTDAELARLNRQFRSKNYATDVLSFPGTQELAISYQRARRQAAEFNHGVEDEIKILMLHGVLHLAGMDHETDNGAMARREAIWRRKLALPNSLIQRAAV
jgi:probable rRNA maturation factor